MLANYQHPMVEVADLSEGPVNVNRLHGATPKIWRCSSQSPFWKSPF